MKVHSALHPLHALAMCNNTQCPPPLAGAGATSTSMANGGMRECRICMAAFSFFELRPLVPCGHNPACGDCTKQLLAEQAACPICRTQASLQPGAEAFGGRDQRRAAVMRCHVAAFK